VVVKENKLSREINLSENRTKIAENLNGNRYIWQSAWKNSAP